MQDASKLETDRLILREWRDEDVAPFAALCADPRVMEHFPATLSLAESEAQVASLRERFAKNGFSFWATELKSSGEMIGFIGLNIPGYETPFTPCVEIGWRLAAAHWGKGYAQEGARASLDFGFDRLGLKEIVALTATTNLNSMRVMERIGMRRDLEGDFDHPRVPEGHCLRRHVLYRMTAEMRAATTPRAAGQRFP
jgi:ribosomal-protein-alanine N-acetyltransferase